MNSFTPPSSEQSDFEHDHDIGQHLMNVDVTGEMISRWKTAVRSASLSTVPVLETRIVPETNSSTDVVRTRRFTTSGLQFNRRSAFLTIAASILICVIGAWSLWPASHLSSLESALVSQCNESESSGYSTFQTIDKTNSIELARVLAQLRPGVLSEGQFGDLSNHVEWKVIRIRIGSQIGFLCAAKVKGIEHLSNMLSLPSEQKSGTWRVAHCKSESHLVVFVHQGELSNWLQPHA